MPISLKRKLYDVHILPVATYGPETMLTRYRAIGSESLNMERILFGISRRDKIENEDIRARTKIENIMERLATLKW